MSEQFQDSEPQDKLKATLTSPFGSIRIIGGSLSLSIFLPSSELVEGNHDIHLETFYPDASLPEVIAIINKVINEGAFNDEQEFKSAINALLDKEGMLVDLDGAEDWSEL